MRTNEWESTDSRPSRDLGCQQVRNLMKVRNTAFSTNFQPLLPLYTAPLVVLHRGTADDTFKGCETFCGLIRFRIIYRYKVDLGAKCLENFIFKDLLPLAK